MNAAVKDSLLIVISQWSFELSLACIWLWYTSSNKLTYLPVQSPGGWYASQ